MLKTGYLVKLSGKYSGEFPSEIDAKKYVQYLRVAKPERRITVTTFRYESLNYITIKMPLGWHRLARKGT